MTSDPTSSDPTDTYHLLGNLIRFLARGPSDGSAYCMVEVLTAPGAGAPPNRHPLDDEAFYVLEGSYEFTMEGRTWLAPAGSFVRVPNGAVHAFRNPGETPARLLMINAPGKVHEGFLPEAATPLPPGTRELPSSVEPPDVGAIVEIGRRHGLEFLPG